MSTDDEMRNNEANEMEEERWRQFLDVPDDDGPPIHRTTVEEARWRQYLDVPDDEQAGTLTEGLGRVDEDEVREGRRRLLLLAEQRRQALQDWDEPQPEAPVWLVYLGGLGTWAGSLALASAPVLALVLPLLWLAFG